MDQATACRDGLTTKFSPVTVSSLLPQSCLLHISVPYINNTLHLMLFKRMAAGKGVYIFYLLMFFHKILTFFKVQAHSI
jgi:hypothetical protein